MLITCIALEALSPLHPNEPSTVIQPRRQSNLGAALASSLTQQPPAPLSTIKPTSHAPLLSTKLDNYVSEASSSSPTRDDPDTPLARRNNLDEQAFGRLSLTGVEPRYLPSDLKAESRYSPSDLKGEPRYLQSDLKAEPRYGQDGKVEARYSFGETSKLEADSYTKAESRYSFGDRQSLVNDVRLSIANELDNSRLRNEVKAEVKPQQETSPSVRIANTLRRLDAELAKSQQSSDRPRAISADSAAPSNNNLESIRQMRLENEQRRTLASTISAPSATALPISTATNNTSASTQMIKVLIQEALEDFSASLRNDLQNMHVELIRQSMAQRQLIESLLTNHGSSDHQAELQRLRTENEHLKQLLNRH